MGSTNRKKVGLVFFPAFDWAISPDHPEREERLLYTRDQIVEEGLLDVPGIEEFRPTVADENQIDRVHVCVPSTSEVVTKSHMIAAGGTITAADLVFTGQVDRAFAVLRPPGHHANRIVHGSRGFCTINTEAIMVEHIRHTYGPHLRIAIVDTDAHHGDGTQDIFYNDPGVLHISIHQDGRTLYPGSGFTNERGGPKAYGHTINVPLPPGTGDEGLLYVLNELVLPILADYQPDIVINAAGQDNHYSDPLTNMNVTAQGYAQLTELLAPDLVVLEGGYSIEGALPYVNAALLLALAGLDYSQAVEPDFPGHKIRQRPQVTETVKTVVGELQNMWVSRRDVDLGRIFGEGHIFERQRSIYYDTDGIVEEQKEQIRLCSVCSGWRFIQSGASRGFGRTTIAAAVLIPRHVCSECENQAQDLYEAALKKRGFHYVYLQDAGNDIFLKAQRKSGTK